MKKILFILELLLCNYLNAQTFDSALPEIIATYKKSAVPIIAYSGATVNYGTAVIIGNGESVCAVTCEHVVAIKDTNNKTLRYCSNILVGFNKVNDSTIFVPAKLIYTDKYNDFAILGFDTTVWDSDSILLKIITPSQIYNKNKLKEGESVCYIGYPFSWGIGKKNYPISRIGIISQLTNDNNFFLIDGFVQHGNSGSPVFVFKNERAGSPVVHLIGIARAYPEELTEIFEKTKYSMDTKRIAIINPGYTIVTPMDKILEVLNKIGLK